MLGSKGRSHIDDNSPSSSQLGTQDGGPKELATAYCHQSEVRASDNKAHSSINAYHATIKVDIKKSWGCGLSRDNTLWVAP